MKLASYKLKWFFEYIPIVRNKITVGCPNDLKLRKSDEHLKEEMDLSFLYAQDIHVYE